MRDVDVAIEAVTRGSKVVQTSYRTDLERIDKGRGDFATAADVAAERTIVEFLRAERAGDRILGEELGHGGRADSGRTWLIDPLCGTINYAAGMPVVGINAALVTQAGTIAAAVADPFHNEVFFTDGEHAHSKSGSQRRDLLPTAASRLVDVNLDPPFPNRSRFQAAVMLADDEFRESFRPRVVSSSLALAWVASGQRAAYVTDGCVVDSVHFAAGLAICAAAGCHISDHGEIRGGGAGPESSLLPTDRRTRRCGQ